MPGIAIAKTPMATSSFLVRWIITKASQRSLFKVDGNGDRVVDFNSVHSDEPIVQALVLASGKVIVRERFIF